MNPNVVNDTLARIAEAQKAPLADPDLTRSFTQSSSVTSGLTFYDLEGPAKLLYPVITPLRNKIARVVGGRGTQANWRAITGINTNNMRAGVSEGNRGGVIGQTTADYLAKFVGMGLENSVSFEADYAAEGFDDVKARAVQGLLQSTMIQEERTIYGGCGTVGVAQPGTITATPSTTGGTLAAATYSVIVAALTHDGWQYKGTLTTGVAATITKTNADATTDTFGGGLSQNSGATSATTTGSTGSVACSVPAVPGAVGYAWYFGTAGSEKLVAYTTINSVVITATNGTGQLASANTASDNTNTKNGLVFDGLLYQIIKSGSGAYVAAQPTGTAGTGTKLTSDGAGGISEISTAFQSFWDNYRLSPDVMYVGSQVLMDINAIIIKNGGAPLIRYSMDGGGNTFDSGTVVGTILNKITNKKVAVVIHPDAAPGTILFYSDTIPYPLSNVGSVVQMKLRRDYYQIEWPVKTRRYEYGVYLDGVLQNYFPPAFGLIYNIAPGN
jgi:hypothetical protein